MISRVELGARLSHNLNDGFFRNANFQFASTMEIHVGPGPAKKRCWFRACV
ncbi:hypothetical protein [Paraburkholderia sp. BL6669N2]|uniref:hypothetical protein n=1 Tax=Paraburkholderia sp. BL6669N2 TaxID=1938807 RepID=UPI0015F26C35|nr:hypothetical protein [Paraburkholderia sp. BL6669N2]